MRTIDSILRELGCDRVADGIDRWQFDTLAAPYSVDELIELAQIAPERAKELFVEHRAFLARYDELTVEDKRRIEDWILDEFCPYAWRKQPWNHPRPTYNWNVLKTADGEGKRFLDVGPAHGFHTTLLYKVKYEAECEFHACDLVPAYAQLLTLVGVRSEIFDARSMRLTDLYEPNSFDAVSCCEVLEHTTDEGERNIVESLVAVTKPGGKILITFPFEAAPEKYDLRRDPLGHVRQPLVSRVVSLMEEHVDGTVEMLNSGTTLQHVVIGTKK